MLKVLVVGQTPPPYCGQSMMIQRLVDSRLDDIELIHVRMGFSTSTAEMGRFRVAKLWHLVSLVARIAAQRLLSGARVLYYPPGGPNRVPMWRDFVVLLSTRWLFDRVVFHFHASGLAELYDRLPAWQRWLFRRAYFDVDAAVRIAELTPQDGQLIHARQEFVVPNGIEDPWSRQIERTACPASSDRPLRILYVGMLHEGKGLLQLVDACHELDQRGVHVRLGLMGPPSDHVFMDQLRTRISAHCLDDRITLLGMKSGAEKWAAYEQADVLCHPTWYDTVPVVIVEAMAATLPVVSTWHSGIPSLVDDGRTGMLVAPRDSSAIADRLAQLADDGELRVAMGRAGRARFERQFTISTHIERMRHVFLKVGGIAETQSAIRVAEVLSHSC